MEKSELRKDFLKQREHLDDVAIHETSSRVLEHLIDSEIYEKANHLFTFVSYRKEVDTHSIIKHALKDGKNIYVPVVNRDTFTMGASKLEDFSDLRPNYMGILEPSENKVQLVDPEILDLIITPGLAFSKDGYRIGYGGGFYDKFFATLASHPLRIGIGYPYMLVDTLPHDDYDEKLDLFLSNDGFTQLGGKLCKDISEPL
ncbi:5-formyltetrahydrofolate cyclo-ligase [Peptoniphilus equinus]|uniref:5-formyltetrahydrofolate cyclo-ligase n=1 Tax=Peptoniphilus equinus TaxID=3016343 RepID=A0ABY7QUE0_9FIRM|nr:5-formyltetrahydrofolate cyclo-ligase [Peptoniphilus equinus]WBW49513.1 5-formyltetrahydrofolate cyclo-ligase [Peptoniphilus equinus]